MPSKSGEKGSQNAGKKWRKVFEGWRKKVAVDDSFLGNEGKINQSAHKKNVTKVVSYSVKR